MTYISIKRKMKQKYPTLYSDCIDLNTYKPDLFDYVSDNRIKPIVAKIALNCAFKRR